jgi:hypothetical protein
MAVPNIFANATTSIPLSQLDTNFATAITLGNTAVYLGNTTTTLGNVTFTNANVASGNVTVTNINSPTSTALTLQSAGVTAVTIDTSQNLLMGTTSNLSGVNGFQVSKNAGASSYAGAIVNTKTDNGTVTNGFLVKYTNVSPSDGNYMFLCQDSGNTNRFYVTNSGGTGGTSDANLKKNIETTRDGYAEDLCKIRIVKYNWKEQSDDTQKDLGWIAQEVEQVFPRMIKTDADTGIKSVTHSAFVPMLIKAIQEQQATINELTARIVVLESK